MKKLRYWLIRFLLIKEEKYVLAAGTYPITSWSGMGETIKDYSCIAWELYDALKPKDYDPY